MRCMDSSIGFTLIELLVVIAIIALLVSILLPSLNAARNLARTAICGSNLHHVAVAVGMYQSIWNMDEPWLFTNGSGDNPDESWNRETYPHLPGNPAMALADRTPYEPSTDWPDGTYPSQDGSRKLAESGSGALVDTPELFFCPHYDRDFISDYSPLGRSATWGPDGMSRIWGTYSWYWRHVNRARAIENKEFYYTASANDPAPPHAYMNNIANTQMAKSAELVMADTEPVWNWWLLQSDYAHYNGMFVDLHVELIEDDDDDFLFWLWGPEMRRIWP